MKILKLLWRKNLRRRATKRHTSRASAASTARCTSTTQAPTVTAFHGTPADDVALSDTDIGTHHQLAVRFRNLAEQDLQHLVRQQLTAQGDSSRSHVARALAQVCQQLCTDPNTFPAALGDLSTVDRALAQEISHEFIVILDQGAKAGGSVSFNFEGGAGQMHEGQQPWSMCDPALPVQFVVIPAYCVAQQPLSHQVVYTS